MAEPQPSNVREGADIEDEHPTKPASAEDRKAAAALSSLDVRGDDDEATTKKSEADQKALGEAMSRLEVAGKINTTTAKTAKAGEGETTKKKSVKVDQGDVALLVGIASVFSLDKCSDPEHRLRN